MKKRVVLLLLALCMCMVTACGDKKNDARDTEDAVKEESADNVEDTDGQAEQSVVEGDISPEFKKEVDDYEKFFFDYVEVFKLYYAAGERNDLEEMEAIREENEELFDKYPKAMGGFTDIMDNDDLTEDEQEYWKAASKRITEKLKEALPENEETE